MLIMIGLGLWDEKDITLRGLEKAKESEIIYLESYTSKLMGCEKQALEQLIGKKIQLAPREFIEKGGILNYAKSNKVALLIPGDPMVATTHSDLILQAREKGIKCEIVHNASVQSAIAETGLQVYKFGRSATITFWEENYKPTSWFDVFRENQERGLHTLFFLDLKMHESKFLTAQQAVSQLLEAGLSEQTEIVVCSQLGSPNSKLSYGKPNELLNKDIGLPLQVIVIPGNMHDKEKEFLEMFRK